MGYSNKSASKKHTHTTMATLVHDVVGCPPLHSLFKLHTNKLMICETALAHCPDTTYIGRVFAHRETFPGTNLLATLEQSTKPCIEQLCRVIPDILPTPSVHTNDTCQAILAWLLSDHRHRAAHYTPEFWACIADFARDIARFLTENDLAQDPCLSYAHFPVMANPPPELYGHLATIMRNNSVALSIAVERMLILQNTGILECLIALDSRTVIPYVHIALAQPKLCAYLITHSNPDIALEATLVAHGALITAYNATPVSTGPMHLIVDRPLSDPAVSALRDYAIKTGTLDDFTRYYEHFSGKSLKKM